MCLTSWQQARDLRENFQEVWPASRKTIELFLLTSGEGWCRCQELCFEVFKLKNSTDLQWPTVSLSLVPHPKKMVLAGHAESWIGCQQSKAEAASWLIYYSAVFYSMPMRAGHFSCKDFEGKDVKSIEPAPGRSCVFSWLSTLSGYPF